MLTEYAMYVLLLQEWSLTKKHIAISGCNLILAFLIQYVILYQLLTMGVLNGETKTKVLQAR